MSDKQYQSIISGHFGQYWGISLLCVYVFIVSYELFTGAEGWSRFRPRSFLFSLIG